MKPHHLYLAYGSNMNPDRIASRLGPDLIWSAETDVVTVTLSEHKLCFRKRLGNGSAAADLVCRTGDDPTLPAEAVIWKVTAEGIAKLDAFEGVGIGHYRREEWTVRTDDRSPMLVSVYLAEPGVIEQGLLPTHEYLQHLIAGSSRFLSRSYAEWISVTPFMGEANG